MMKSAWGSDDPTKAVFPFLHGLVLSEAGHSVQILLLGEAPLADPRVGRRGCGSGGMAALGRDAAQGSRPKNPNLCLWSLQSSAGGNANRLRSVGSEVWQSDNIRFARGMGRSRNH